MDIDSKSISIMLAIDDKGEYTSVELMSLRKLLYKLMKKYKLEKENIVLEYDVNCSRRPFTLVDEPVLLYNLI